MNISQLQVGDLVTHVNGMPMTGLNERVVKVCPAVGHSVAKAQVEFDGPNPAGIERWLYDDQHEVEVVHVLPARAFEAISDSLLVVIELLEDQGDAAPQTRAILKALHRFSTPSTNTQVVIRPKVG